jgi:DDE family transposase
MIEAVFGQTKHNRGMAEFRRRGRSAVRTEWRLIAATHNLVKLHKRQLALAAAYGYRATASSHWRRREHAPRLEHYATFSPAKAGVSRSSTGAVGARP